MKIKTLLLSAFLALAAPALSQTMPNGGGGGGGGGAPPLCGDSSHALGGTGSAFTCQAITGSAAAGGSDTQLQYNNATALGGISGATSNGTSVTISSGNLKLSGASSGTATLNAPATGGGTLTLPAGTDTVAGIAATQTITNKSIDAGQLTGTVVAARMPAYTGDATSSAGAVALTLATVNGNVGTFGSSTQCPTITANAKGLITAISQSACAGGGGGSLTITDGTNSVSSVTTATFGNGFLVGGSAGSATVGAIVPNNAYSSNHTVGAADMGGTMTLTSTGTLTIPAISGTVFAANQTSCFSNVGSGAWTISTTPTINGMTGTSIPPGSSGCLVSNGTSLDFQPGMQLPSSTKLGGVITTALASHNFATGISTSTGALTGAQPAFSDISGTVDPAQLPLATTGAFGAVKCDGSTITCTAGVIASVSGGAGTVTTLTAGTNITFSSGATCTTTCTINSSGGGSNSYPATFSGNVSASFWGATGTGLIKGAANFTDTSSSGTVTTINAVHATAVPVLLASSSSTYNEAATVHIAGPPTASTNVTIASTLGGGTALSIGAGNLTLKSSGMIQLFNVGSPNATNTEQYDIQWSGGHFGIFGNKTGTGSARNFTLSAMQGGTLVFANNASAVFSVSTTALFGGANGADIGTAACSVTNPTLRPNHATPTNGWGCVTGTDDIEGIINGSSMLSITSAGLNIKAGAIKMFGDTTGAGSALLGANSPATTNTSPYTWLKFTSSDGSTVYVPAFK